MDISLLLNTDGSYVTNEVSTFFFGVLPFYGLFLFSGFMIASCWALLEWNKKGYRTYDFLFMASFTVIFSLYGAKLWYMVFSPGDWISDINGALDLFTMIFIPAFGRSILGTVIFTPIGLWIWQRTWGGEYKTLELIDFVMPAMLLAQGIGRFGNMFDHNVYGHIVDYDQISWLPNWITKHLFIDGYYRQPLFLYESIMDISAFVLLIIIFKTNDYWNKGVAGSAYFTSYGLIRTIIEPFRDSSFKMSWGSFPTSVIASVIILIIGIVVFIWLQWGDLIKSKLNK